MNMSGIIASLGNPIVIYGDPGWVDLTGNTNLAAGVVRKDYNTGYFGDNPSWFATQTPSNTTYPSTIDIGNELNSPTDINHYSIEWTGYFSPMSSGNYIFRTVSDDGSYFWIGTSALAPDFYNMNVNNSGAHGTQPMQGLPVHLTSGKYYPIRAQFGEIEGGAQMSVEYSTDSGYNWTTISNMVYDSTTSNGFAL